MSQLAIELKAQQEIESLRQQLAEKDEEIESFRASYESTYEQNLRLANQLGESEAERLEQARLLGMSGEREAGLLAEIERLKKIPMKYRRMAFNAQLQDENNELRKQLAASQAREQQLREALKGNVRVVTKSGPVIAPISVLSNEIAEVLAQPSDTTALEAMIAKAGANKIAEKK